MIRYFTAHPTAANLVMALMIVVGLAAMPHLLRETFPRVDPREVEVSIAYPGATADEVARALCARVEDALDGLRHLDEVRCNAFENRAVAVAEMRQGADFTRFTADIETEIGAIDDLPETAEAPVIRQLGLTDIVAVVAVTADGDHALTELKALAEDLKTRMLRWGGIPAVEVAGFAEPEIRIEVDETAARALGLSLEEIAAAVGRQNLDLPLGELVSDGGTSLLRFADQRRAVDGLGDMVVASSAEGGTVRLADIARIVETVEDREVAAELNGRPAAILRVTKAETDDTLRVMEALRAFLDHEDARLPPGVTLSITGETASVLDDRLTMLAKNSAQGLALVFAVMWLFLGLRQAFWIAAGLPVAFLGALGAMVALGYSINMLTLVALLIVIGILMDDAIVIAENIETQRAAGLPPIEAAVTGARQVAPGVIASFATTSVVFGALSFLQGDLGELLRVVPAVMLLVLVVSLVEAFLILPAHLSHGAPARPDPPRRAGRWLEAVRQTVVGPVASAAVAWRWLTLGITLMAFLAAMAAVLGGALKFEAFPALDGDQVEARLALPAGSSIEQTEAAMTQVLAALDRVDATFAPLNPDGEGLLRDTVVTFGENADIGGTGAHLATARVDLLGTETRGVSLDEVLAAWRAKLPALPAVHRLSLLESVTGPAGRAIEIRLAHDDLATLQQASAALRAWLSRYAGTQNIADDLAPGRPERRVTLRDGAGTLDLDARAVADQLRAGFEGAKADVIEAEGETWRIELKLSGADRETLGDLEGFSIKTPAGARVPLEAVAEIKEGRGQAVLRRIDGRPTVTVTGDVDTAIGNADEIVRDTLARFLPELQARHPALVVRIKGASEAAEETTASMAVGLAIGVLLVFIVLSIQLRSYAEPMVVMAIIPFALIGAVAGHLAMGIEMSLPSMLGFASLAGIVVNDSILLVHVIKQKRAEGYSVAEAAPMAAEARFRAILMTSLTTVVGVAPLLFETSLQAQPLIPMVTSIAFGLTATTLLILLVVPAFYAVLDELGLAASPSGPLAHVERPSAGAPLLTPSGAPAGSSIADPG
ncbi:MAG: efflux RND transporter permease subunit [Pseudomonadota bacterium]